MTLKELEFRINSLALGLKMPLYDDFVRDWDTYDALSKSLYIAQAECHGLCGTMNKKDALISSYLQRMGLVNKSQSLEDILFCLESDVADEY